MKKARKIKINGEEFKWFLDKSPNELEKCYYRVILYKNGEKFYWNTDNTRSITNREVKQAYSEGKFHGPY